MKIWEKCQGEKYIQALEMQAWRVVEAQHKSTTRVLVDNVQEHEILEQMIENSKPQIENELNLHYLLFTPFRYPPLKYGSRFGSTHEPSLWYGSQELNTAFSEVAYYRLHFLNDTEADLGFTHVLLTAYSVPIKTRAGIFLDQFPFQAHRKLISSSKNYSDSQSLGGAMRAAEVEAFTYFSARTKEEGLNIAVFTPRAFAQNHPNSDMQTWKCLANKKGVEFIREGVLNFERVVI